MKTDFETKMKYAEREAGEKGEPVMNEAQAIKVLESQLSDPEKFKKFMPKEMRAQFEHGMKLHEEHRAGVIAKILTCSDVYTEDELKAMETPALEKLAKAVKAPVDYSGQSGNVSTNKVEEPLIPPQI
jgi:hypothetical protein